MKNTKPHPPKLPLRFFRWYCHPDYREDIEGDLLERFEKNTKEKGIRSAKRRITLDILQLFRPGIIRSFEGDYSLNQYGMFKHNIKIGWRNLYKNKGYSAINFSGLAIGMAVAMIIGLWVKDELSFNRYHDHYQKIAKVMIYDGDETNDILTTGMGSLLKTDYGNQFERVAMVRGRLEERAIAFEKSSFLQNGYFMQEEGPEMFSLKMIKGTRDGLNDTYSILLSESLAKKLFKDKNPLDQIIKMDDNWDLTVTGVYEDLPKNSEFYEASYFAPLNLYLNGWSSLDVWDNYNMQVFVQLHSQKTFEQVTSAIKNSLLPHFVNQPVKPELFLHPMSKWHLYSEFENGKTVVSNSLRFVWLIGIIGVFVLLLAVINFMNLSTARSEKRAKEVGIRKSIGSVRIQLISQFLSESGVVVCISFILTILIVALILPWFNGIANKTLVIPWANSWFWLLSISLIAVTDLLAGSYPAFYLSSFSPIKVLKGTFRAGANTTLPRKVLVVIQFTISICLVIGTVIIYQQIQFAKNRPMGYSAESLLTFPLRSSEFKDKYESLRSELKNTGLVKEIALSNYPITSSKGWNTGFDWEGKDPSFDPSFNAMRVSPEYGRTIGLEFVEGRDFSRERASDKSGIIINESALSLLGIQDPVGKTITKIYNNKPVQFTILGVVKDMIKGSPYEPSFPSIIFYDEEYLSDFFIKLDPDVKFEDAIPVIEKVFHKHLPFVPFDYKFVDDVYEKKFESEAQIGDLAGIFTILAIFISCMGLFALTSFVAEQRTKEIGIRKILGASAQTIWVMLSKDFLILVGISCIIAIPLSYILLSGWLQNYEYRTDLKLWVFGASALGTLTIAMFTVSFQAFKAAFKSPVNSLRSE